MSVCERGRALVSVGQTARVVYRRRCRAVFKRRRFEFTKNTIDTDIEYEHVRLITLKEPERNAARTADVTAWGTRR